MLKGGRGGRCQQTRQEMEGAINDWQFSTSLNLVRSLHTNPPQLLSLLANFQHASNFIPQISLNLKLLQSKHGRPPRGNFGTRSTASRAQEGEFSLHASAAVVVAIIICWLPLATSPVRIFLRISSCI